MTLAHEPVGTRLEHQNTQSNRRVRQNRIQEDDADIAGRPGVKSNSSEERDVENGHHQANRDQRDTRHVPEHPPHRLTMTEFFGQRDGLLSPPQSVLSLRG